MLEKFQLHFGVVIVVTADGWSDDDGFWEDGNMIGGKEVRPGYHLPPATYGSRIINLRASACKNLEFFLPSDWNHLGNYRVSSDMKCSAYECIHILSYTYPERYFSGFY